MNKLSPPLLGIFGLIGIIVLLYILAVGPYWNLSPDSAIYVQGGKSLAEGEGYTVQGNPIRLFPPMTSLILSPVIKFLPDNYTALNFVVTLFTLLSLLLFFVLFRKNTSTITSLMVILLSIGSIYLFRQSTRLLSETFYMFFSAAFLFLADNLKRKKQGIFLHIAAGSALLAACMTRSVGISLLAATIFYTVIFNFRKSKREKPRLIFLIAVIIIPLFFSVLWGLRNYLLGVSYFKLILQKEMFVGESGLISIPGLLTRYLSDLKNLDRIGVILINGEAARFFTENIVIRLVGLGICSWGLIRQLVKNLSLPGLYLVLYLMSTGAFITYVGDRYLIPVVPLLFFFAAKGLQDIHDRARFRKVIPVLIRSFSVLYIVFYLGVGIIAMIRIMPNEHRSPFGKPMIKYEINYEMQECALWLRNNSPQQTAYICQHPAMWDIITARKGHFFPFSRDPKKLLDVLSQKKIDYILADKNKEEVQKFLLPVIVSNAQRFELLKDSEKASLYRVRKPKES